MFDNNDLPNDSIQFTISHEVITFLRWLTEHYPEELKKFTKKSLQDGLLEQLQKFERNTDEDATNTTIIDFFSMMELIMHESLKEHASNQAQKTNLQTTIDHIDGNFCDDAIVKASLETVSIKHAPNADKSAKEMLFKEILKQWQPHNSQLLN